MWIMPFINQQINYQKQIEEGLSFKFIKQLSEPLNLEEQYKFYKEIYQFQEEGFQATISEKQYDSEDISNENVEIMSEEIGIFPSRKRKSLKWSTKQRKKINQQFLIKWNIYCQKGDENAKVLIQ